MKYLFLINVVIIFTSCSALVRKDCEKVDWRLHGENLGKTAQSLEGDQLITRCVGADYVINQSDLQSGYKNGVSLYCSKENFYDLGVKGDPNNISFCPTNSHAKLNLEYQKGTQKHCTKRGAYLRGVEGKTASEVCDSKLSLSYKQYFQKGRKKFISSQIQNEELVIAKLRNEINQTNTQLYNLDKENYNYAEQIKNPNYKKSSWGPRDPETVQSERNRVLSTKETLLGKIGQSEKKILDWRSELNSLDMDDIPSDEKLD